MARIGNCKLHESYAWLDGAGGPDAARPTAAPRVESWRVLKRSVLCARVPFGPTDGPTPRHTPTGDSAYSQLELILKCYDYCIDEAVPPSDRPGAAYKWADIGYNSKSDAEGRVCGHGEKVPCYCATACPETFGDSQGLIAGPCDADEPLKLAPGSGDADSRAP